MKPLYPVARLRDDFHEIDAKLDAPLRLYMIGGGALGFHGLKDRTKDVDIVTARRKEADALAGVLDDLEYEALNEPSPEYEHSKPLTSTARMGTPNGTSTCGGSVACCN